MSLSNHKKTTTTILDPLSLQTTSDLLYVWLDSYLAWLLPRLLGNGGRENRGCFLMSNACIIHILKWLPLHYLRLRNESEKIYHYRNSQSPNPTAGSRLIISGNLHMQLALASRNGCDWQDWDVLPSWSNRHLFREWLYEACSVFRASCGIWSESGRQRLPMLSDDCLTSNSLFQQTFPRNTFCSVFFWADSAVLVWYFHFTSAHNSNYWENFAIAWHQTHFSE